MSRNAWNVFAAFHRSLSVRRRETVAWNCDFSFIDVVAEERRGEGGSRGGRLERGCRENEQFVASV